MSEEPVVKSPWEIAEGFRRSVLFIIGCGAMAMGVLLGTTAPEQGPSFQIFGQLAGWPWLYGILLSTFGMMQVLGVRMDWRSLSVIGCGLATLWYLGFGITFVVTWFDWVKNLQPLGLPNPSIYPVAPYLMIGAIHFTSVETLYQYWKAGRQLTRRVAENPEQNSEV